MKAASHLWNLTFDIYNMKEVDKAGGPEEIAESRKISPVCQTGMVQEYFQESLQEKE